MRHTACCAIRTFTRWDTAGCPPVGKRPGEGDVVATRPDGRTVLRYASASPLTSFTGESVARSVRCMPVRASALVRDIPAASDLVRRLWNECVAAR